LNKRTYLRSSRKSRSQRDFHYNRLTWKKSKNGIIIFYNFYRPGEYFSPFQPLPQHFCFSSSFSSTEPPQQKLLPLLYSLSMQQPWLVLSKNSLSAQQESDASFARISPLQQIFPGSTGVFWKNNHSNFDILDDLSATAGEIFFIDDLAVAAVLLARKILHTVAAFWTV